jgi:hypothetical protein
MTGIKVLVTMFLAVALVGCGNTIAGAGPARLPSYDRWQTDVTAVMNPVIPWLRNRMERGARKPAIVLDIDNTALETHYNPGEPNKPVLAVAGWAKRNNVSVLFVTLREASDRGSTMSQLGRAGYAVDGLCMKTSGEKTKPRCREVFAADGYTITANIGNRETDFDGGDYEKAYRLPDYDGRLD